MKKQIIILMLMAASLTAFASCESESRVDDLKEFVEKVQKEAGTYTEEKWEEVNDEFSKLLDKLNQYEDLSEEELKEIDDMYRSIGGFLEGLTGGGDDEEEE